MVYRYVVAIAVLAVNGHCQYYEWPQQQHQQQYNNFNAFQQPFQQQQFQQQHFQQPQQYHQHQQQFQQQPYQQYPPQQQQFQPQYQPQQQQPQYFQPQPQQQQPQPQPQQYQPPQQPLQYQQQPPPAPPPIYSQTVIIPQAPPPPPEAYQAQQYTPGHQQTPVMVQPADIPRYHQKPPPPPPSPQVPDVAFQHVNTARSVQQVDLDNKLFREQPNSFTQNQEKITLLAQPPPPPPPPAQTQAPLIRVPPPPARFIPTLKSLYSIDPPRPKNPTYQPDEIIVDGHRSAYFEDTQRTKPQAQKSRVQSVGGGVHSSSANIPRPASAAVVAAPQQHSFVKPTEQQPQRVVRPQQPQQHLTRPAPVRPQTRRPVPQPQPATRPAPRPIAPKSHLAPQPAPVVATPAAASKPKTASEKFLQCCKGRRVHNSCERICSFDVLSKKTLTGMFLGTDPCPQHHGLDLMQCAADNDDHTECCLDREVDRTSAGKKCLGFCNMKPGITFQADVSMLPCWSVLNDIKQCFKENLERQLAASA